MLAGVFILLEGYPKLDRLNGKGQNKVAASSPHSFFSLHYSSLLFLLTALFSSVYVYVILFALLGRKAISLPQGNIYFMTINRYNG